MGAQTTRVDINAITRRTQQAAVEANITAFGTRHFKRDNRPKEAKTAKEKAVENKIKAKGNAQLDNFYTKRAQQQANIVAPAKITAFRSTETMLLLGDEAFDDPETLK